MEKFKFSATATLRRIGITLLVCAVLASMAAGWVLDRAHGIMRVVVRVVGLARAEEWLRRRSIWFAFLLIGVMVIIFIAFKEYEISLLLHKHVFKALSLALAFKILWAGTMNYLLHLYSERFLAIALIAYLYGRYVYIRALVLDTIKKTTAYQTALRIKRYIAFFAKHRSMLAVARRLARKKY